MAASFIAQKKEESIMTIMKESKGAWQDNMFEEKIGKVLYVVEAKDLDKGRETAEEKLKNIMIKDLIAKDNAMAS